MAEQCSQPEFDEPVTASRRRRAGQYLSRVLIGTLRLRRVQLALTTILVSLLVMWFPHLEALHDDLLMLVAAILMIALGGYSVTDALYHGEVDQDRMEDLLEAMAEELGVDVDTLDEEREESNDGR